MSPREDSDPDSVAALDPIAAASRLGDRRGRVLLHSGRDDDGCGRWSFVACDPLRSLEARGRRLITRGSDGTIESETLGDPLSWLASELQAASVPALPGDAPLPLAMGYLGYDLGRAIETLPQGPSLGDDVPDLWFGFYGAVARWGDRDHAPTVVGHDPQCRRHLSALLERESAWGPAPRLGPLVADGDAAGYRAGVERILEYIAAGDVYQVNLARRLVAQVVEPGDALAMYRALWGQAPAPYGGLIEADGVSVVSGSPELFLRREAGSGRLETRPIKGTRRRTGDPARDRQLCAELIADEKEQAEHLMIVDLERNDLGRVAELGSVRVDQLGYVVELPALLHMVSRVSCELRADAGVEEILRASFPGGSITGAPKIRAMEIIDELEPARRGPYTGALGYFGAGDAIELAIAIRCAALTADELRFHVGGGIVADSTASRELEETEEKAAGWRAALRELVR